jgi:hypothetical protein
VNPYEQLFIRVASWFKDKYDSAEKYRFVETIINSFDAPLGGQFRSGRVFRQI